MSYELFIVQSNSSFSGGRKGWRRESDYTQKEGWVALEKSPKKYDYAQPVFPTSCQCIRVRIQRWWGTHVWVTQIAKASDPSLQCSHLISGNAKSFMTSCAAFGKRFPNCSCFCIDSAQRGKASLQLAGVFIDHRVPPQLSPSSPRPLYFGGRKWESHLFPLLKAWAGHFNRPLFPPSQVLVFVCFPAHHPFPPPHSTPPTPTHPYFRGWGPRKVINPPSYTGSPARYLLWRASGRPRGPTCLQSLGRGRARARGVWLWLSQGVRSSQGKMPLEMDSPTSSGAALVGPCCFAF